jgi:hypothetical protein
MGWRATTWGSRMTIPSPIAGAPLRTDEPLAHALPTLLAERGVDLGWIGRQTGFPVTDFQDVLDDLVIEPPDVLLDALARAFEVSPAYFLEYRLSVVLEALDRDPTRLNVLFLRSLTPLEQSAIGRDRTTDAPLRAAVTELLAEEGVKHGELADNVGWSPGYLRRLLGEPFPSSESLESLALALGVEPHHFREYRLAVVGDWLRERPAIVDDLFDEFGDALALAPYAAWVPRALPPPEQADAKELLRTMLEIVGIEGPVSGRRVYTLLLRAAGSEETKERKSRLNRAAAALLRTRRIIADNETGTPTQIDLALRLPSVPQIVARRRGQRLFTEIPLREIAAVAKAAVTARRLRAVDELQEALSALYDVGHPTSAEREHMNRVISYVTRTG